MYTKLHLQQEVMGNKDKARDGDAATAETRDSRANRDHSRDWKTSRDATALAKTIAKAVAQQTKSIVEMFSKQKAEGDTVHHRSIFKGDGEGICTI